MKSSNSYKLIKKYYGHQITERSKVKLMNHIDEGLECLEYMNASQRCKEAYCLHPILQGDEDFNNNLDFISKEKISPDVIALVVEYRRVANSYLSNMNVSDFVGFTNRDISMMLCADKIQNKKDFDIYHKGFHKRSDELSTYFDNWIDILTEYDPFYGKIFENFIFSG